MLIEPASRNPDRVILSIVVPLYNEADNVDALLARLEPVLETLLAPLRQGYEIVFVDDGSADGTAERILAHRARNRSIKLIGLSRNFGKETALTAGLDHACGAAVVPLDADLQDPPELIPALFEKWREGYEVVYARRAARDGDSRAKRVTASWFYRVHNWIADVVIPADTGDFRLMDRRVVDALARLRERGRFMKGLFAWVGFRQIGIDYRREPRAHGKSKWRYFRLWNLALDGIASSSTAPLRIWTYIGFAISSMAFLYGMFLLLRTLVLGVDVPGYTSIMVAVLFMGGINLLTLGIIGEYLGRTYLEAKQRPLYLVRDYHGFDPAMTKAQEWTAQSTHAWESSRIAIGGSSRAGESSTRS
jgi:glycosyltransferase involved in cell wall biosynthesis